MKSKGREIYGNHRKRNWPPVLQPNDPEWLGLPKNLKYVADWTCKLEIVPCQASDFYVAYAQRINEHKLKDMRTFVKLISKRGDISKLEAWVDRQLSKFNTQGQLTVLALFGVLTTLEQLGKLGLKETRPLHSVPTTPGLRRPFPQYLLHAARYFGDYTHGRKSGTLIKKKEMAEFLRILQRTKRDARKIRVLLDGDRISQQEKGELRWLLEFLADWIEMDE